MPALSITTEKSLGPLLAAYRAPPIKQRHLAVFALLGLLFVLAPLSFGLYRGYYGLTHYGPVAAVTWSRNWLLGSLVAFILLMLLGLHRLVASRRRIAVHAHGLELAGFRRPLFELLPFTTPYTLMWSQIEGIAAQAFQDHFRGRPKPVRYRAVLFPRAGKPIRLHGIDLQPDHPDSAGELSELISRLKASLYPRLLPKLRAAFSAGEWLSFGPLAIQRQNIRFARAKNQPLAWNQVKSITVKSGCLVVELHKDSLASPRHQYPVSQIPNLELLLQIIDQGVKS